MSDITTPISCSTWGFRNSGDTSVKISRQSQLYSVLFSEIFGGISVKYPQLEHLVLKHPKNQNPKKGEYFWKQVHFTSIRTQSKRGGTAQASITQANATPKTFLSDLLFSSLCFRQKGKRLC